MSTIPTSFYLFGSLPIEIRLQIWELAHIPRIVYLQQLSPYRDDVFGGPFYKLPQHKPYPKSPDKLSHGFVWVSPSGCYRPSPITFACKEAFEAVNSSYEKLFLHQIGYPQLWFNFAIDTLYLDWGWVGFGLSYTTSDLLHVMGKKVKHVALLHRERDVVDYALDSEDPEHSHESLIQDVLDSFSNLMTLTLVNRRHYDEDAHDLVFLANVQAPQIWEDRQWDSNLSSDIPSIWDSKALDLEVLRLKMQELEMELPEIATKLIADRKTAEKLFEIAGGEERLPMLLALDDSWLHKMLIWEEPCMTAISQGGQIEYLRMIVEAWKKNSLRWKDNTERTYVWSAQDLEESLVWMENKAREM